MIRGPKIASVVLTADEHDTLQRWARRPTTAQALAMRARIVLASVTLHSVSAVARELRVTKPTVARWRHRFVTQRLEGLLDEPRPGAPRQISDADVERVLTTTLESTPRDATHWSTPSLAKHCGLDVPPPSVADPFRFRRLLTLPQFLDGYEVEMGRF